jgi:hypothetical protein
MTRGGEGRGEERRGERSMQESRMTRGGERESSKAAPNRAEEKSLASGVAFGRIYRTLSPFMSIE